MLDGKVRAKVLTFGEANRNGDVHLPGSFKEGQVAFISSFDHDVRDGQTPVGMGTIHTLGRHLIFEGRYDLLTSRSRDAYTRVCVMGDRIRWSLGCDVYESHEEEREGRVVRVIARALAVEVSPVHRPADPNTRTLWLSRRGELATVPA